MKDLVSIALFVKVAKHKSFSEAAKRLGVSVSTVSRKVSQLEQSLGVRLIERSTRRLRLTHVGESYYELCQLGIEEFESASLMVNNCQVEADGILRLSVPPSLDKCLVIPLVSQFQEKYPKVRIRIWSSDQKLNLIDDGIDLALRVGKLKDSNLVARKLLDYRHILVASPGYLKKSGYPEVPTDLNEHRLISFTEWYGDTNWTFTRGSVSEVHTVSEDLALNDYIGLQMSAEADNGITELPSIICHNSLSKGTLVEVLPEWKFSPFRSTQTVTLSAVYPSKRHLSSLVRLFKDFCVDNINDILKLEAV